MITTLFAPATDSTATAPRILIVGGGAGGLQLATRLAQSVGRKGNAEIVLVDRFPTHFWKPLLHEAASGHRDSASDTIEYAAQAKQHGFRFVQGELQQVDRAHRIVTIGALRDEDGVEILPTREIRYDDLVLAVGSVTNFFNVPGAQRHTLRLENVEQAEDFRQKLLAICTKVNHRASDTQARHAQPICLNVIGAGATGVELTAALRHAIHQLTKYRFQALHPERDFHIRLIEGAPRVLPVLEERTSGRTHAKLRKLGIDVRTGTRVAQVEHDAIVTSTGERLASDISIWAAGVAGPPILRSIGNIALNAAHQAVVTDRLQTPDDPHVFAFGDCAACPLPGTGTNAILPPRAQVAHQQAIYLSEAFARRLAGKPVAGFVFRDTGTVVSFGQTGAVYQGGLGMRSRSLIVDGLAANGLYKLLYPKHLLGVYGIKLALLQSLSQWLKRRNVPAIKLH